MDKEIKRLAIFASGTGSNARNIFSYFQNHNHIEFTLLVCNKTFAPVVNFAIEKNIPCCIIDKPMLNGTALLQTLNYMKIDLIILAGFLLPIPQHIIDAFPSKILNLHPSLLPKYGGKGMYGMNVHNAVINNNETKSGITIHLVNEKYDDGKILFQYETTIDPNEDALVLAQKIHELEEKYFPKSIEQFIKKS